MAASNHIDDRLSLLKDNGINFELVSSFCGEKYKNYNHKRLFSLFPSGLRYEIKHIIKREINNNIIRRLLEIIFLLPIILFYIIEKLFIRLDATWSWFMTVVLFYSNKKFDVIYSTGGAVSGQMAALILHKITKIPLIVEFQDPLTYQYSTRKKLEYNYNLWLEKKLIESAKVVIFLTKQAVIEAKKRVPNSNNIIYLYPYCKKINKIETEPKNSNKIEISHFGTLSGSRNLDTFILGLDSAIKIEPSIKDRLEIKLFGHIDNRVQESIKAFDFIKHYGKIDRDDVLKEMFSTDVLLVIQNCDDVSTEAIPSKIYEYLQVGKLIFGLLYNNIELKEMLDLYSHKSVDVMNINEIASTLIEISSTKNFDRDTLDKTVKDTVFQLIEIVNSIKN
jgi:hypothetical protein